MSQLPCNHPMALRSTNFVGQSVCSACLTVIPTEVDIVWTTGGTGPTTTPTQTLAQSQTGPYSVA